MARITIGLGVVLIALGIGGYLGTSRESLTALIPAALGLVLAVLGVIASTEKGRTPALVVAMVFGLLGVFGSLMRPLKNLLGGEPPEFGTAVVIRVATATLLAIFVVLCLASFVQARRAGGSRSASSAP